MLSNDFKPKLSPTYFCEYCDYTTCKKSNLNNHFNSIKHKSIVSNDFKPKLNPTYFCEYCDYVTCKKSNIDNHFNSIKHKSIVSPDFKPKLSSKHLCKNCGKEYKDNSGLWRHTKVCTTEKVTTIEKEEITDKDLIMMLIKQNSQLIEKNCDLTEKNIELSKNNSIMNSHNNTTNSHNKAFNLNFFLNETCKDAMNITDFVESIKLQLTDLERVGELGYVEGISNIITSKLKALDVTQRPVHCTDKKRETMYVKDENTWEKDEEKKKMHKLVKKVADKNMRLLPEYREKYPDYNKASSLCSDKYNQMFLESFGGSGDNNFEKEEKIIQKVSREVFVDKAV